MIDPTLPLQSAVVTALKADATVAALVSARVYDLPPPAPTKPYVTIGEFQMIPDRADCLDGAETAIPVHGWSQTSSTVQVKQLGAAIIAALDEVELSLSGHRTVLFELEQVQYVRDPDGITNHTIVTFRALTEPV